MPFKISCFPMSQENIPGSSSTNPGEISKSRWPNLRRSPLRAQDSSPQRQWKGLRRHCFFSLTSPTMNKWKGRNPYSRLDETSSVAFPSVRKTPAYVRTWRVTTLWGGPITRSMTRKLSVIQTISKSRRIPILYPEAASSATLTSRSNENQRMKIWSPRSHLLNIPLLLYVILYLQ